MKFEIKQRAFALNAPVSITGLTITEARTIQVQLDDGGLVGRGEALGLHYMGETDDSMVRQLEEIRPKIEAGLSRAQLQTLLPPGGARNALDVALWDLEAKKSGASIWELIDTPPKPLVTAMTLGIDAPKAMANAALAASKFSILKLKLDAETPIERIEAVRAARPDATLVIDINQGWTFRELIAYTETLQHLGVRMIEQPLPRGHDQVLETYTSPIPLAGDESCLSLEELPHAAKRYDIINIKLDKCGGLTEALEIVRAAKVMGLRLMVGNMGGSSLSMAPGFVIGQFCEFVDLDGPLMLSEDMSPALMYQDGGKVLIPSQALWG